MATVVGGPPLPNALHRKKPGPKPKAAPEKAVPGSCPSCQGLPPPVSFELCKELLKSARDKLNETEVEQRGKAAELDLLYLAARLDGYCSLSCWRRAQ